LSNNFGLKIGLEGEKQFKKALTEIKQSFKVLGSEMQLVTSQFDKNDKSVTALAARKTVLTKEIGAQKDKITTLQAALDNASESFGENDKRTQNWQIQLNKAQAELNDMERELGKTEQALDDAGDEMDATGKSADGLGDEVEQTGKAADDAGKRFEGLKGILKGVGAAMCVAMKAIGASAVAAGKSALVTLPPKPVPVTDPKSMPRSAAMRVASGVAFTARSTSRALITPPTPLPVMPPISTPFCAAIVLA